MFSSVLLGLLLAKSIVAAPAPARFDVENDVVVLLEDGNHLRINYTTWVETLTFEGFSLEPPKLDAGFVELDAEMLKLDTSDILDVSGDKEKRAECGDTRRLTIDKTERFVDWDIQMSNVVCATGSMNIWVTAGWSVANTIGVNGGFDLGPFVGGKLKAAFGVDFSRSWTTSTSIQNVGTVDDKTCGVMITKPLTTRRSGRVLEGCVGAVKEIATWYADDRGSGSYGGVSWVAGAVGMCKKPGTEPPLTRCNGQGEFK